MAGVLARGGRFAAVPFASSVWRIAVLGDHGDGKEILGLCEGNIG
jgi:hypothetical protein